jgi:hypothetical protein
MVSPSSTRRANILPDPPGDLRIRLGTVFQKLLVVGYNIIHIVDMDEGVPQDPGHEAVHLGYDHGGLLYGRLDDIHVMPRLMNPCSSGRWSE